MMRDYSTLFSDILSIWRRQPGCSIQLLTPRGCGATATRAIAAEIVTRENLGLDRDVTILSLRVNSDSAETSHGFVEKIAALCRDVPGFKAQILPDYKEGSAAERLEFLISYLHELRMYPVLLVDRFHAFAELRDGGAKFLLAGMRDLEIDGNLTTINLTPLRYADLRLRLRATGGFPFINSDYGDYHQTVILAPIGRQEFVEMVPETCRVLANKLYAHTAGIEPLVSEAVHRIIDGASFQDVFTELDNKASELLHGFLEYLTYAPIEKNAETITQLSIGSLSVKNEQIVRSHPLRTYFVRSEKGRIGVASSVLAVAALRLASDHSLATISSAIVDRQWQVARINLEAFQGALRVKCVQELLQLLEALETMGRSGILDIPSVKIALQNMLQPDNEAPEIYIKIRSRVELWLSALSRHRREALSSLENLTVLGSDRDLADLITHTLGDRLYWCKTQFPSDQGVRLANALPESILQTMLSVFGVDFANSPVLPPLDYAKYWPIEGTFEVPRAGGKLTLSSLYVVTAAMANQAPGDRLVAEIFREPEKVRSVLGTLINLKNPTSHTFPAMGAEQCRKFFDICSEMFVGFCEFMGTRYSTLVSSTDIIEALFTLGVDDVQVFSDPTDQLNA